MSRRPRLTNATSTVGAASDGEIDLTSWPQVDQEALSQQQRERFARRVRAVQLYLLGASATRIREECGIGRFQAYRLLTERCLQLHPDGRVYGWRGLLYYQRIKPYTRAVPVRPSAWGGGAGGALQWVFESPTGRELETRLREQILGRRGELESSRRPRLAIFRWFLEELRQRGFERRGEWPFNVEKRGYVTLCRHIDRVLADHPQRQRQLVGGPEAVRKARAGDGSRRPDLRLFERVECDAHKLDARMVVMVPSPHGDAEPRLIHRLWVIVLIEVASRAVLGYHLSLRRECSAEDVLRAVKCALSPWVPRDLQFGGHAYTVRAGLPSYRSASFVGACWNEFSVDGALANICPRVETALRELMGARVLKPQDPTSYSCRRSKDDRPFVESFFRHLAAGSFHRLKSTTGSSPAHKRGTDPEQAALATQFQLEYAAELLDTLIANYNATPHSGLGYRTPLDQMERLANGLTLRIANPVAVRHLACERRLCTLLGGVAAGRRPHFNFANARYSAEWLCLRSDLVGKKFWLSLEDEDDARFVSVSTQQGEFLGIVRAAPPWHRMPHSLFVRQAIRALDKRRLLYLSSHCDAVEALLQYAESSPGRKLPPHPAYLEARRILQQHAEALTGHSMVEQAKARTAVRASGNATTLAGAEPPETGAKVALPPMRKAQQW